MENLANTVVVVPLLEKFLLVRDGVTLDEVLQLWEVGGEENTASHVRASTCPVQELVPLDN